MLRSLGEEGIKSELIITKSAYEFVTSCKYINSVQTINGDNEIISALRHFEQNNKPPIVICCDDKSIAEIDKHYNDISKKFLIPNAGQQGRINFLMSKLEQQKLAAESGLRFPKTWKVMGDSTLPIDIDYPCIVKADSSIDGYKSDMKVCHTFDELKSSTSRHIEYLVQEYIEKEYELNVEACSLNHGEDIIIPGVIYKIREYPAKRGSSSFAVLKKCTEFPNLPVEEIKKLLRLTQYEGLFSIEFVCKDSQCYFLEVNFRNDGNGYIPTSAGCNLPYIWYNYHSGKEIGNFSVHTPHYFMADINDILHVIKGHQLKFREWRTDFKRTNCFLLYNHQDKRPFRAYVKNCVMRICNRIFRSAQPSPTAKS